ncbi:hypothetical protein F2Q69_00047747 [Brassica cretica]|uniref:Uncharacterized protein n=1 Tax=Brassica cretica TaxID=69181 RepID=A0A8S9Q1S1_BRACR|nr:hypothetical protein F2Q69_00047747 [Brassica cretica]
MISGSKGNPPKRPSGPYVTSGLQKQSPGSQSPYSRKHLRVQNLSCRFQLYSPGSGPSRKILEKSPSSKTTLWFDPESCHLNQEEDGEHPLEDSSYYR